MSKRKFDGFDQEEHIVVEPPQYPHIRNQLPKQRTWKTLWLKNWFEFLTAVIGLIAAILGFIVPNQEGERLICNIALIGNVVESTIGCQIETPHMCPNGTLYDGFNFPCSHDEDSDGIHDDSDDCPDSGNQGVGVTSNGCPNVTPTAIVPTATPSYTPSPTLTSTPTLIPTITPMPVPNPACIKQNDVWLRGEHDAFSDNIIDTLASGTQVTLQGVPYLENGIDQGQAFSQWWRQISVNGISGWVEEKWLVDCAIFPTATSIPPTPIPSTDNPDPDGDGVFGSADSCPNVFGPASNGGCPEEVDPNVCSDNSAYDNHNDRCNHDEDSDGIPDDNDSCPSQGGTVDATGCPLDSDEDGIIDNDDDCPNEGISEYVSVNGQGCPVDPYTGYPAARGNDIRNGEALLIGYDITSSDGIFTFKFQPDANVVLYDNRTGASIWSSCISDTPGYTVMQGDGNFVSHNSGRRALWSTRTHEYPNSRLVVESIDDGQNGRIGRAVVYNSSGREVWSTETLPCQ